MKVPTYSRQYRQNLAKSRYFFPSDLVTFHSLVELLLPVIKLNGVNQQISTE